MAIVVWPVDAVTGSPSYTGEMLRQTANAWVTSATARPLGARTGIFPSTPTNVCTATSSTWTVGPHAGCLDLEASSTAGSYIYSVNTNQTGSITTPDATHPRIDLIYLQLSDPAEGDGSTAPAVTVNYLAGTPASTPVAPATPTRSLALANINVPQSGGGAPSVTLVSKYTTAEGGIIPCRTSTEYPSSPWTGQCVYDLTLAGLLRYSGSAWVPEYDAWTGAEVPVVGASPTANTRKIRYSGSAVLTTNAAGQVFVNVPTPFPNGLITSVIVPGDLASSLFVTVGDQSYCTLGRGVARCFTQTGAAINTLPVRVNYIIEGW
jgi:hypothetical protein